MFLILSGIWRFILLSSFGLVLVKVNAKIATITNKNQPKTFRVLPNDNINIGNALTGNNIINGNSVKFGDDLFKFSLYELDEAPVNWQKSLHSFTWLEHLKALSDEKAVSKWLSWFLPHYLDLLSDNLFDNKQVWSKSIAIMRANNLIDNIDMIEKSISVDAFNTLRNELSRHALWSIGCWYFKDDSDLTSLRFAFRYAYFAGTSVKKQTKSLIRFLKNNQLPDGGFKNSSPFYLFKCSQCLSEIATLGFQNNDIFIALYNAEKALRTVIHADNQLAIFHGSHEGNAKDIKKLLNKISAFTKNFIADCNDPDIKENFNHKQRSSFILSESGFLRLEQDRLTAILDCGASDSPKFTNRNHSSLAFEFSVGKKRCIVNCGSSGDENYLSGLKDSVAHSGLVLDKANNHTKKIIISPFAGIPPTSCEASQDGFIKGFGVGHTRKLKLSKDKLAGTDSLTGKANSNFDIYFHLHPHCEAVCLASGHDVIIRISNTEVWRFVSKKYKVSVIQSVYCGVEGTVTPSRAINITGNCNKHHQTIDWQLFKIEK